MKVGDLVRYGKSYRGEFNRYSNDVGVIVVDDGVDTMLVQWNNGTRMWRHTSILEVISESR